MEKKSASALEENLKEEQELNGRFQKGIYIYIYR